MARIFKRNPQGNYWIEYWANGKKLRESTRTKNRKEAERCLAARLGEIVQGRFKLEKKKQSPIFRDFVREYLSWAKENKRSWQRDVYAIKQLEPYFGRRRLSDIHPFHVESYKIERRSEVSPRTVNIEVKCLKRMLNLAVDWGKLENNPIRNVKPFEERKTGVRLLSEDEAQRLVEVCSFYLKPVVVCALNTGMRLGEILKLKWDKVDLDEGFISVEETKTNEVRKIPLNEIMLELLQRLHQSKKSDFVFTNSRGQPYDKEGVRAAFNKAKHELGLHGLRFHDLRHTFASYLVMSGVDLRSVQELGGWKSLRMVQRYSHLSDSHLRRAVDAIATRLKRVQNRVQEPRAAEITESKKAL